MLIVYLAIFEKALEIGNLKENCQEKNQHFNYTNLKPSFRTWYTFTFQYFFGELRRTWLFFNSNVFVVINFYKNLQ